MVRKVGAFKMRKFEQVRNECMQYNMGEIKKPFRATKFSAGYDIFSPTDYILKSRGKVLLWTNVKAKFEDDEFLMLCITSGMGKRGIRLSNGVGIIDSDYYGNQNNDGNIGFSLENTSDTDYVIKVGDKIGQGLFMKYLLTDDDVVSNEIRCGGFGSTIK